MTTRQRSVCTKILMLLVLLVFVGCSMETLPTEPDKINSTDITQPITLQIEKPKYNGAVHNNMAEFAVNLVVNYWTKEPYRTFIKTYKRSGSNETVLEAMKRLAKEYSTDPDHVIWDYPDATRADGHDFGCSNFFVVSAPGHCFPADGYPFDACVPFWVGGDKFEARGGHYADENLGHYYGYWLCYYLALAKYKFNRGDKEKAARYFEKAAIAFGRASHYMADVSVPYHTTYHIWHQLSWSWTRFIVNEHGEYESRCDDLIDSNQWWGAYWYGSNNTSEYYAKALVRWEAARAFQAGEDNDWYADHFSDSEIKDRMKDGAYCVNGILLMAFTEADLSVF